MTCEHRDNSVIHYKEHCLQGSALATVALYRPKTIKNL